MWPSQRCCETPKIYRNVRPAPCRPQRLYAVNLLWNKKKKVMQGRPGYVCGFECLHLVLQCMELCGSQVALGAANVAGARKR